MDLVQQFFTEAWKLWLIVGIIFMLLEGLTPGSFSLFFAGLGALATALACYFSPFFTESVTKQLLFFSAMSLTSLLLLRPRVMRFIHRNETQFDGREAFIGKHAKALTNIQTCGIETGKVLFEGTEWAAIPSGDSPDILAGSVVEITQMEGLTLHVRHVQSEHK